MPDFYTVITDSGLTSLGLATRGNKLFLPQAVVGDGNGELVTPHMGMTSLVNEVWRGDVSGVQSVESEEPGQETLIFEFVIKADVGGFVIREVGLLDENGDLFCVGNFPETEKPVISDGSVRDLTIRLPLHFENAETVNLVVDTNVAVATKQDVLDHNEDPQAHDIMKSDALDLDSSISVATSKAVKTLSDLFAQHAQSVSTHGTASTTTWGFTRLATLAEHIDCILKDIAVTPWGMWELIKSVRSDSVNEVSSEKLATAYAVKRVNDALTNHQNADDPHGIGNVMQGVNLVTFTSSGTYHRPANLISAEVYVTGGGASGGQMYMNGAGGGGAGGTSIKTYQRAQLQDSIPVTVGAGGIATAGDWNNGGDSYFLSQVGDGGSIPAKYSNGGVGGDASGGDINLRGSAGVSGDSEGCGGAGGSSYWGGGGVGADWLGGEDILYGSNGSGGGGQDSESNRSGHGGDGLVVIKEFLGRV